MVPTKHQPCQPYTIPHWQEIKIAGFLPGRQAQSSERCVCQSRDLESVHVHSDVKCSMFKAQTGILSPPPNPHAYCIIHKTSIDDCIRGLQLFLFCCEANSSRDFNLVPHNAIFCIHIQAETRHKVIKNIINGLTTIGIHQIL